MDEKQIINFRKGLEYANEIIFGKKGLTMEQKQFIKSLYFKAQQSNNSKFTILPFFADSPQETVSTKILGSSGEVDSSEVDLIEEVYTQINSPLNESN